MLRHCLPLWREAHIVLGVSKDATKEEVKAAYQTLAKVCHPDVGGSASAFQELKEAAAAMAEPKDVKVEFNASTGRYASSMAYDEAMRRKERAANTAKGRSEAFRAQQHSEAREASILNENPLFKRITQKLALGLFIITLAAHLIRMDIDEEGLSWVDRPHPGVFSILASKSSLSTKQKLDLEKRINRAIQQTEGSARTGHIPYQGMGYVSWEKNLMVRSNEFKKEIIALEAPKVRARWKKPVLQPHEVIAGGVANGGGGGGDGGDTYRTKAPATVDSEILQLEERLALLKAHRYRETT